MTHFYLLCKSINIFLIIVYRKFSEFVGIEYLLYFLHNFIKNKVIFTIFDQKMHLDRLEANGHVDLLARIAELQQSNRRPVGVFVLFTGNKMEETGRSWCPDCVAAEPVIDQALGQIQKEDGEENKQHIVFITCSVGFRDEWKAEGNSIKADETLGGVRCVPTLIEYSLGEGRAVEGRRLDRDEHFATADQIRTFIIARKV